MNSLLTCLAPFCHRIKRISSNPSIRSALHNKIQSQSRNKTKWILWKKSTKNKLIIHTILMARKMREWTSLNKKRWKRKIQNKLNPEIKNKEKEKILWVKPKISAIMYKRVEMGSQKKIWNNKKKIKTQISN